MDAPYTVEKYLIFVREQFHMIKTTSKSHLRMCYPDNLDVEFIRHGGFVYGSRKNFSLDAKSELIHVSLLDPPT